MKGFILKTVRQKDMHQYIFAFVRAATESPVCLFLACFPLATTPVLQHLDQCNARCCKTQSQYYAELPVTLNYDLDKDIFMYAHLFPFLSHCLGTFLV